MGKNWEKENMGDGGNRTKTRWLSCLIITTSSCRSWDGPETNKT